MVDLATLKRNFKGDIVDPTCAEYPSTLKRWALNAERKARYVLFPKTETDVSFAVRYAAANGQQLAIHCGGHSCSGASSAESGVVIDMSRFFNTTRVDPERKIAYVGGGATWATVDAAVAAHGLGTPGGTVNHTGVGGLILGGGYGWLSGEHGLVIDNLVEVSIVTADGSIVSANERIHPDLFWAVRGGGSNFGVVTEFVLKCHPQRQTVFAGQIIFPPPAVVPVAEAVDEWFANAGEKEAVFLSFARGPERKPVAVILLFYNGSEEEGRAVFKKFYELGHILDLTKEMPYVKLNTILNDVTKPGRNYYTGGSSLRSKCASQAQKVFDTMVKLTEEHPSPDWKAPPYDIMIGYEFFPLKKINSVAPDATAFRSRGPQPNVMILVYWERETNGRNGVPHARGFSHEIIKLVESTEDRPPTENENYSYGNYQSEPSDMASNTHKLWGDNYPRLQKVKKQYDPNVVFNKWFPIQPA